ncbi:MAG TPA: flagellar FlbD family protein [bacterium]|nr:flagellar FlbD family protein [bacterium]
MIELKRLNDQAVIINSDLIEFIEATPDTMITLTSGRKIVVKDSVDEVVKKVIEYRRNIHEGLGIKQ